MMRKYLSTFAALLVLFVALTAGALAFIDPYGIWGAPRIAGLNEYRPEMGRHLAAAKLRQFRQVDPKTLIAGNSRVHVGLDPASASWPASARPVYNLGLPGSGTDRVAGEVEAMIAEGNIDTVYLGVDFIDFRITKDAGDTPGFSRADSVKDKVYLARDTLFSLDAAIDAGATIMGQHTAYPFTVLDNGLNGTGDYDRLVAGEGHRALFAQRERENIAAIANPDRRYGWTDTNPLVARVDMFLKRMKAADVNVVLFTYPYHSELLSAYAAAGAWPEFERWKTDLAVVADRHDVPLYDFAQTAPETMERAPVAGDTRTRLDYYWEAGHFKAALGDLMIARMTGGETTFGSVLTAANVAYTLERQRRGLLTFADMRPDDMNRIERIAGGRVKDALQ
ncbi:hypothetical protein KCG44_05760 [Pacificimonas sp. WHA3]|uniref:Uncharacterized protein n=1 Tax=Pacificimonas pallii TaxID=2827236 RepID=A0ABS6SCZ6_9SPHN|nr:hypothetical protein [Pacificimonas pallii]MBV7256289.1 hypothetical protein [Pacificimonas pallii]